MKIIGQEMILNELKLLANDIRRSGSTYNILLSGSSGCGKTTIAKHFTHALGLPYEIILGGTPINRGKSIHIIDEAHLAPHPEIYYEYLDNDVDSLVLTTTHLGLLPEPFRNRCIHLVIEPYTHKQLIDIASLYSKFIFPKSILEIIVDRTRGIPREIEQTCNRLLLHLSSGELTLTEQDVSSLLNIFGLFTGGFTRYDKEYLKFLNENGRASLSTINAVLGLPKETLLEYVEPFLLKGRLITITSRGRQLTPLGKRYLESL